MDLKQGLSVRPVSEAVFWIDGSEHNCRIEMIVDDDQFIGPCGYTHHKDFWEAIPEPSTSSEEVRITDPETGGQKGQKLAQLGALDPLALLEVGKVAGFGATKYARYNFAKGYAWSLSYDALQRHLNQFWSGENKDGESNLYHLAHAAWHCLALLTFVLRNKGTDDRFPSE